MKQFFTIAILSAFGMARIFAAETAAPLDGGHGRLILTELASAPFPHPQRADGHKYDGQVYTAADHYRDSTVGIFIPKGFVEGERVDFVVHFHGWRNHVAREITDYQLIDQFVASGRNAVLVLPQGPRDAPDSFGGKLEDVGGFKRFMEEVTGVLRSQAGFKSAQIGRIILSGHSGGYRVIAYSLAVGGLADQVKEVWLFDALYAETEKFAAWQKQTNGKLINLYTANGGTKGETEKWLGELKARGTPVLVADEEQATSKDIKNGRLIFLFTKLPHNDVVSVHHSFQGFLQASLLAGIPASDGASH